MEKDEYRVMYDIEQSYWWFVGKQFLMKTVLNSLPARASRGDSILDIGCGTGIVMKLLAGFGTAFGMELSQEAIQFLKQRGLKLIVRSDAGRSIPFKANTFSTVSCLDVLEHLDDDSVVLDEMVRVCKPGGHIIITVPACKALWSVHDEALHHKRRYSRKDLLAKAGKFNCAVLKSSYYNATLMIPILAVRKLRSVVPGKREVRSDFFMPLPRWLNILLAAVFVAEIRCLRFLDLPFGVSLLLVIQKPKAGHA